MGTPLFTRVWGPLFLLFFVPPNNRCVFVRHKNKQGVRKHSSLEKRAGVLLYIGPRVNPPRYIPKKRRSRFIIPPGEKPPFFVETPITTGDIYAAPRAQEKSISSLPIKTPCGPLVFSGPLNICGRSAPCKIAPQGTNLILGTPNFWAKNSHMGGLFSPKYPIRELGGVTEGIPAR